MKTPKYTTNTSGLMLVGMQELISDKTIQAFGGYVVVADLVGAMANSFQTKLCVDQIIQKVNRYAPQFFHIS